MNERKQFGNTAQEMAQLTAQAQAKSLTKEELAAQVQKENGQERYRSDVADMADRSILPYILEAAKRRARLGETNCLYHVGFWQGGERVQFWFDVVNRLKQSLEKEGFVVGVKQETCQTSRSPDSGYYLYDAYPFVIQVSW